MSIIARILIGASLFSSTISGQTSLTSTGDVVRAADLVFRGGTVWTADAARPSATAVAVRNGRISYVGDAAGVQAFVGAARRVIDLQDGMLLPGFHDSHVHIVQGGLGLASCDLSMDATAQSVALHIAACARANPNAAWVTGRGWQLSTFPNASPTRAQLDAIVPEISTGLATCASPQTFRDCGPTATRTSESSPSRRLAPSAHTACIRSEAWRVLARCWSAAATGR